MSGQELIFAPLVGMPFLLVLAGLMVVGLGLSVFYRLRGSWARALAALCLLMALSGPELRREAREPLRDILLVLKDASASGRIGARGGQADAALAALRAKAAALPNLELHEVTIPDGPEGAGTEAVKALAAALAEEPANRVAGALLITDGQAHDAASPLPPIGGPVNVVLTGARADWDRALTITRAPAFGIIGEETTIGLRIDEQGRLPGAEAGRDVDISIAMDGEAPRTYTIPVNRDMDLPVTPGHAGQNVVQIALAPSVGELTDQNNMAVVQMNGVRDRLRVLLVSGQPYAGERTWRNLLKSDASVDLVHFTILRPPEKEDGVPVDELALIAFPTRELFVEKIDQFDLIIFDRYPLRGILPSDYLDNIRDYVLGGGALLVAAGPEFASAESLYFSGVGEVMPADPTTRVVDGVFLPTVSDLGKRHPVTEGLEAFAPRADRAEGAPWGRWLRRVELANPRGQVVLQTPEGDPLLILNREGEGRVALLASDQAWLWARGYEGGGPQQELLRRLAHWMMKEPDLEEESLSAAISGSEVTITRRSLREGAREVTITAPDGGVSRLALTEVQPGLYRGTWQAAGPGLYRLKEGDQERVFALGAAMPKEFADAVPSETVLQGVTAAGNGGFVWLADGVPDLRAVRAGRPAAGRGWVGYVPRGAFRTLDLRLTPPLPDWALLLAALGLMLVAWLQEGARRRV